MEEITKVYIFVITFLCLFQFIYIFGNSHVNGIDENYYQRYDSLILIRDYTELDSNEQYTDGQYSLGCSILTFFFGPRSGPI